MQRKLIWLFKQLSLSLEQYGRVQLEDIGLSPTQGIVLNDLFAHKGQIVYSVDLHHTLGLSKATVSSTLKSLKQKGYLELMESPADDRKKQILLTSKAYELEKTIDRRLSEQQENLCRSIPMQHLECMERDLHTMLGNLRERQDWGNRYDKNTSGAGEGI